MRKKRLKSKAEIVVLQMPPLVHSAVVPFDIRKSEVVLWMIEQPAVLEHLFNLFNTRKAIVFREGRWVGAHYEEKISAGSAT